MIHLIYGTSAPKRQDARERVLKEHSGKNVSVMVRGANEIDRALLEQVGGGASLFDDKIVLVLEYPFDGETAGELLLETLPQLEASENTIIVLERELAKDVVRMFEKAGAEVGFFDEAKQAKKQGFNVFSITDSFIEKDKKETWLLYREAIGYEHAPEEIIGVLFWALKNMLLLSGTQGSSGLSPFVASKARRGLSKWKKEELENASRELVRIVHGAHSGLFEIEEAVERFILKIS
jgi:hypothetical protein